MKKIRNEMRIIQLECIIFKKVKNNSYEFLLLKRVSDKGWFWQPICGGLEKEESKLDAAYREIFEESGIKKKEIIRVIEDVYYFEINKNYLTGKPIPTQKEYVFAFEVKPTVKVKIDANTDKEHEEHKWVSFDNAIKLLKWEDNKEALRKLKLKI